MKEDKKTTHSQGKVTLLTDEMKSHDLYESAKFLTFQEILARVIITVAAILGLVGNTLSAVLLHRLSKPSENVMPLLLKVFAMVDNVFLITSAKEVLKL